MNALRHTSAAVSSMRRLSIGCAFRQNPDAIRNLRQTKLQIIPQRRFGAGQPESQSMKAKLFEGHPENEGWETITNVTYAISAVILILTLGFAPDSSIKTVGSMGDKLMRISDTTQIDFMCDLIVSGPTMKRGRDWNSKRLVK